MKADDKLNKMGYARYFINWEGIRTLIYKKQGACSTNFEINLDTKAVRFFVGNDKYKSTSVDLSLLEIVLEKVKEL
jgi:hypothetical protein